MHQVANQQCKTRRIIFLCMSWKSGLDRSNADSSLGQDCAWGVLASAGWIAWHPYLEMDLEMACAKADAWAPPVTKAFAVASAAASRFAAEAKMQNTSAHVQFTLDHVMRLRGKPLTSMQPIAFVMYVIRCK